MITTQHGANAGSRRQFCHGLGAFLGSAAVGTGLATGAGARPGAALAQAAFPARPLRIVVPYPAGGATDYVARLTAERLSKALGQPVIVDNRSGAAGAIGVAEAARARPDGHTLLFTISDPLINNTALFKSLPYDPRKDLAFVGQILLSPTLLSASPDAGIRRFDDLRAKVSARTRLSYASWGTGGLGHLQGETLNRALKADMVHVPQRGEGPVVTDLLGNNVSVGLSSVSTALQHVQGGKIVPLAVMMKQRSTAMPNVPTLRELGFPDPIFESSVWMSALVPAGTPSDLVTLLTRHIQQILDDKEVRGALIDRGFEMLVTGPEQASTHHRSEFDLITARIRELGIEPQ